VVLTITKRNDAKYTEAKEAQRVILNGLINAGNENIDLVCDAAGLAHLQDPSDVTYFLDGLHLTAAGYADVASLVATGILTL
jgi:lysophospholipase L1-like esterase